MRVSTAVGFSLTGFLAIAMLAGCSGGGSEVSATPLGQDAALAQPVQHGAFQNDRRLAGFQAIHQGIVPSHRRTTPDFMDPNAVGKPLVFVQYDETIDIYLQGGKSKSVGQITRSGIDLAADAAGNLYSANGLVSPSNVTIYAPPYTSGPKLTLSGSSAEVAVSRQGIVAVGAYACEFASGGCSFRFYAAGSTTPCATVALDEATFPNGVYGAAFDRRGNLYAASSGLGTEAPLNVAKIDGGCNAKKAKTLSTTNPIAYAGQIRVDKAGRLAIFTTTSDFSTYAIDTYDPPRGASLGNPVSTTPLFGSNYIGSFAFKASGLGLWLANFGFSNPSGATEYAYPTGGTAQKTIVGPPDSGTYGIAVSPPLVP